MKNKFIGSLAVLTLVLAGVLTVSVRAQTTEEGNGPSEQPSAPDGNGQPQSAPPPPPGQPGIGPDHRTRTTRAASAGQPPQWERKLSRVGRRAKVRLRLTRVWAASA